jgi:hypothetical protein
VIRAPWLFLVRVLLLLNLHIPEFAGFEHRAAFLALDVLGIFIAGHDLHLGMLALLWGDLHFGGLRGLARRHKTSRNVPVFKKGSSLEIGGILGLVASDVKSRSEAHVRYVLHPGATDPSQDKNAPVNRLPIETYHSPPNFSRCLLGLAIGPPEQLE